MKKFLTMIMTLCIISAMPADAQVLKGIAKKAKDAAERTATSRVLQKVDQAVTKSVDKVADKIENTVDAAVGAAKESRNERNDQNDDNVANVVDGWTCPECGHKGNTGKYCDECGAKRPADAYSADNKVATQKSDFVPGSIVIFEDNLVGEQLGEFPSKWDLLRGVAEVARINGVNCIAMSAQDSWITPLMENNSRDYLGDVFTVEWDMLYDDRPKDGCPNVEVEFVAPENRQDSEIYEFLWSYWDDSDIHCDYVLRTEASNSNKDGHATKKVAHINDGQWHHFAVSFNQRALKFYVDDVRIINIPNAKPGAGWVDFWSGHNDNGRPTYLKNVRIGKGAVELYGQNVTNTIDVDKVDPNVIAKTQADAVAKAMTESGKFVTNNILFDTGKATLKEESMTDIKAVAEYMKANPSVRFEVQGHCDNQGSDSVNDPLSQKRAEAIVAELVKLGVDEWNLRAVGKGSHEPVADNNTEAGRAQNRRVEFIKK